MVLPWSVCSVTGWCASHPQPVALTSPARVALLSVSVLQWLARLAWRAAHGGGLLLLLAGLMAGLLVQRPRMAHVYTTKLASSLMYEQLSVPFVLAAVAALSTTAGEPMAVSLCYGILAAYVLTLLFLRTMHGRIEADRAKLQADKGALHAKSIAMPALRHRLTTHAILQHASDNLATDASTMLGRMFELL